MLEINSPGRVGLSLFPGCRAAISASSSRASSIHAQDKLAQFPLDRSSHRENRLISGGRKARLRKLGGLLMAAWHALMPLSDSVLDKVDAPYRQALPLRRMIWNWRMAYRKPRCRTTDSVEVFGFSLPSEEVGGDFSDLARRIRPFS